MNVSDDLVDRAYELMTEELGRWQIVGPQIDRNAKPPREFYTAARAPKLPGIDKPRICHLQDKAYAVACVQWHGLQAVLTGLSSELAASMGAGPSSNTIEDNSTPQGS